MRGQDNKSATLGGFRQFDADRRALQTALPAVSDDLAPRIANTRVSVVIPHYSDLEHLDRCLTLLQQQTYPADLFEIVVSDNDSPEGSAAVADAIAGRAKMVMVEERGAGPARNGGVEAARGTLLAFIDSDCAPEPEWLAEGVSALSGYDFVGGKVRVLVKDAAHVTAAEAFERVFAFDFEDYILRKGFTGSGNLFCPRWVFDQVGGFRTGVSEDVDWSHRATRLGFRLGYAPRAVVGHPARRTWVQLQRKWKRANAEAFGLFLERPRGRWVWLLRCLLLPASAVAHAPKVLFTDQLESVAQRLAALSMLFRLRFWRCKDGVLLLSRSGVR